jgi:DNA-directed RNA polymerase alpha subunit
MTGGKIPIDILKFERKTSLKVLKKLGVTTLDDCATLTSRQLEELPNVSDAVLNDIRTQLSSFGIKV